MSSKTIKQRFPLTIEILLQQAKTVLQSVTDQPLLEAEILLADALKKSRSELHTSPEKIISVEAETIFQQYLKRRSQQEPFAYIIGKKEFWSLELSVNKHTLIPRPETELLVEQVLQLIGAMPRANILDLGTGSGAIALALAHERPSWTIYAMDNSEEALDLAKKNAQTLGLTNVSFAYGDWRTTLRYSHMDVVVSNPPYITETEWPVYAKQLAFEPKQALLAGVDGLEAIRVISESACAYLKQNGYLLFEHGYSQANAVRGILADAKYTHIYSVCDLARHERVTVARTPLISLA